MCSNAYGDPRSVLSNVRRKRSSQSDYDACAVAAAWAAAAASSHTRSSASICTTLFPRITCSARQDVATTELTGRSDSERTTHDLAEGSLFSRRDVFNRIIQNQVHKVVKPAESASNLREWGQVVCAPDSSSKNALSHLSAGVQLDSETLLHILFELGELRLARHSACCWVSRASSKVLRPANPHLPSSSRSRRKRPRTFPPVVRPRWPPTSSPTRRCVAAVERSAVVGLAGARTPGPGSHLSSHACATPSAALTLHFPDRKVQGRVFGVRPRWQRAHQCSRAQCVIACGVLLINLQYHFRPHPIPAAVMRNVGTPITEPEAKEMIAEVDDDGSGEVGTVAICSLLRRPPIFVAVYLPCSSLSPSS